MDDTGAGGQVSDAGRRARALCPDTCGCTLLRYSPLALSLPHDGCGEVDNAGLTRGVLDSIPCTDVSTDDPTFVAFLDNTAKAAKMMPLDDETRALREVAILRKHGCAYLSDPDLWHDMSSIEAMIRDIKNKSLAKSPYFLGRSLCVRNAGTMTKPLSLFCPQACGCHRGDQDCPLSCPERTAPDPPCPAYQRATYWLDNTTCPRLPAAQTFDVGVVGDIAGAATG